MTQKPNQRSVMEKPTAPTAKMSKTARLITAGKISSPAPTIRAWDSVASATANAIVPGARMNSTVPSRRSATPEAAVNTLASSCPTVTFKKQKTKK